MVTALYKIIDAALDRVRENPSLDEASEIEAGLAAATGGPDHLVRVEGRNWTIQHPLHERFEDIGTGNSLIDCRYNDLVRVAMVQRAMSEGTHRVWIDRTVLQWDEIG